VLYKILYIKKLLYNKNKKLMHKEHFKNINNMFEYTNFFM